MIIGRAERFGSGKQVASYLGLVPGEESSGNRRRLGHIHQTGEFDVALFAGGSGAGHSAQRARVAQPVLPPGDATRTEDCQGRHGSPTGGSTVLDDAPRVGLRAVEKFGPHAGQPGNRHGVQQNTD